MSGHVAERVAPVPPLRLRTATQSLRGQSVWDLPASGLSSESVDELFRRHAG